MQRKVIFLNYILLVYMQISLNKWRISLNKWRISLNKWRISLIKRRISLIKRRISLIKRRISLIKWRISLNKWRISLIKWQDQNDWVEIMPPKIARIFWLATSSIASLICLFGSSLPVFLIASSFLSFFV